MLDLSNIFNKDIKKAILSKEQLAEMLKVTPEALEAFERSYQLHSMNDSTISDNLFKVNAKQAAGMNPKLDLSEKDIVQELIDQIVKELLAQVVMYSRDWRGIMKDLILIIVSILWCIPILISFVISGLRKKLESDRNFYGKEISPKDIELVKVRYKPIDMKASDFSEYNKDGELQYFYKKGKSQDVVYAISKQEYDRYFLESTVESITAYYPEFIFSYQSTNGSMKATIESYKPTIERYYNPKDIEQYKKLIAKRCEKQVFAKVPGSHFEYKDCKGQTVVHNIDIDTKTMHGTITGESNKESGKWDYLFYDESWYPQTQRKKNRFLSFCSRLDMRRADNIFTLYFTIGLIFTIRLITEMIVNQNSMLTMDMKFILLYMIAACLCLIIVIYLSVTMKYIIGKIFSGDVLISSVSMLFTIYFIAKAFMRFASMIMS